MLAIGLMSCLSLLLVPLERLQPAAMDLGAIEFRLIALINPLVLVAIGSALGCFATHRVGLDAPLLRALVDRGGEFRTIFIWQAKPALAVGIGVAIILVGYAKLTEGFFAAQPGPDLPMPLITRVLYGGIVEEIVARWGLMSLFAWAAIRLAGIRPATGFWLAAALAALLFAAGHLPLLYALAPSPPAGIVAAVLIGNFIPGLLFGLLFWKRGLEAAMLAHALAHILAFVAGAI